ncbi:MAG: hypothetical protein NC177_10050 [Ruminococcus flavefaciens]|nr:hypothetical protein [Ruminococcus flavefaciens]
MNKTKFLKDTWKPLLVIFIVIATLFYYLVFDGSRIPFLVTFLFVLAIIFIKCIKSLIKDLSDRKFEDIRQKILLVLTLGAWIVFLLLTLMEAILL